MSARSEIDLRLGAAFTRFQTLTLQERSTASNRTPPRAPPFTPRYVRGQDQYEGLDGLLSYGPCQFPTMWFVVQRAARHPQMRNTDPCVLWLALSSALASARAFGRIRACAMLSDTFAFVT